MSELDPQVKMLLAVIAEAATVPLPSSTDPRNSEVALTQMRSRLNDIARCARTAMDGLSAEAASALLAEWTSEEPITYEVNEFWLARQKDGQWRGGSGTGAHTRLTPRQIKANGHRP